jgi:predicted methyltransferase
MSRSGRPEGQRFSRENRMSQWRKGLLACALLTLITHPPLSKALPADLRRDAIAAATADPTRPATDTARDANRKPAETLEFAGVKPGDKIADYAAGAGYFTRLFADVTGPKGHVYASVPSALFQYPNIVKGIAELQTYAVAHPNVTVTFASALGAATYPEKLDVFWISQNYHDLHDGFMGPVDMAAFNRMVFAALKPGGLYIVLDHVAAKGSPADVTDTLHRIEPSTVRREVEAAGFKFEGESTILANPADPHTAGVFDPSIRGRTDQFILKFRRPPSS